MLSHLYFWKFLQKYIRCHLLLLTNQKTENVPIGKSRFLVKWNLEEFRSELQNDLFLFQNNSPKICIYLGGLHCELRSWPFFLPWEVPGWGWPGPRCPLGFLELPGVFWTFRCVSWRHWHVWLQLIPNEGPLKIDNKVYISTLELLNPIIFRFPNLILNSILKK